MLGKNFEIYGVNISREYIDSRYLFYSIPIPHSATLLPVPILPQVFIINHRHSEINYCPMTGIFSVSANSGKGWRKL